MLGVILALCCFTAMWFFTGIFSEPVFDEMAIYNDRKYITVSGEIKEESNKPISSDVTLNTDISVSSNGDIVTDTEKNPKGLPIYSGYTGSGDYFDVDYKRFWNMSGELFGLGDWTNIAAKNAVSREFSVDEITATKGGTKYLRKMSDVKSIGGYWTAEGRLAVALPPGAIIEAGVYEPKIQSLWGNKESYKSKLDGTKALVYVSGVWDNSLMGMHVDCVLEDGTVIAMILMDAKALHSGVANNGDVCKDDLLQGYAHWRGSSTGALSYKGIIEVGITKEYKSQFDSNKNDDLNLSGNRIVSFRCYPRTKGRLGN